MNPAADPVSASAAAALAPPPQPPQPHRPSTSCDRHPDERFTGFCPSCLCERLAVLDQNNNAGGASSSSASARKPSAISAAALKAIFKPSGNNAAVSNGNGRVRPGFFPELRRTKSFSASKNEGFSGVFEPQRRSCDVRVRSTLWNLFSQDEQRNTSNKEATLSGGGGGVPGGEIEVEPRKSSVREPVFETKEEVETESESGIDNGGEDDDENGHDFEIVNESSEVIGEKDEEIVEEEEEEVVKKEEEKEEIREEDLKPMKDHIDLDSQVKKPSVRDFAGSFWSAASVFSKKLQKWRQKQKMKKRRNGGGRSGSATLPVEKPIGRQLRDTQSEIADYGFGRRSCDTDPRFSLDAGRFSLDAGRFSVDIGRVSLDETRYSFDEPRASWDGYLIGRTAFPPARIPPPPSMLSVVEDAPVHHHVARSDMQIPVEEPPAVVNSPNNDAEAVIPGGSAQTRDYYTDSSTRRRKSLDRSSSIRKTAAAVVAEMDELKPISNAKVSPAVTIDSYSNSNSVRDDCSVETTETGFFRENASVIGNGERKGGNNNNKKWKLWGKWSILGFIHRKSMSKYEGEEEDDRYSRSSGVVERSWSESWPELRNGGGLGFTSNNNAKMMRSNSNVSWRSSGGLGFGGSMRKNGGLERNRSSRYSPKDGENGMLRFYLTPMRGSRRAGGSGSGATSGWEKTAARANNHGHSIARSVMRLY